MERVHAQDADDIQHAAIAIGIPDKARPHQLHTGVVYRLNRDRVQMLHLQFHHALVNDSVGSDYFMVECDFIEERLQAVSAVCRRIARRYESGKSVPYGLTPPNDAIDALTGQYLLGPDDTGLTCATFVLAIFQSAELPLIDLKSWPPADQWDRRWQRWIAGMLLQHTADKDHANAVLDEVGAGRIRPEHVAAAAIQADYPSEKSSIDSDAERIGYKIFSAHCDDLLDGYDEFVTVTLQQFLEDLFKTEKLTPFSIQFQPNPDSLVRYHHPFQDKDYLNCHLPRSGFRGWVLANLPIRRWLFKYLVYADIERKESGNDNEQKQGKLKEMLRAFLAEEI